MGGGGDGGRVKKWGVVDCRRGSSKEKGKEEQEEVLEEREERDVMERCEEGGIQEGD